MTGRRWGRGRWWQVSRRRGNRLYRSVTVMHASPTGGPVLRGESSWRTANGVLLRVGRFAVWGVFRRPVP